MAFLENNECPGFQFEVCGTQLSSAPGYICWSDLHKVYEKDKNLDANLRKAPKLTYSSLHPGNNKQNVELAVAVFHETTVAACQNYFPERLDIHNFLKLVMCWWLIGNSTKRYTPNALSNAVTNADGKISFYLKLADWVEDWSTASHFCLTKQTASAFVLTLRSQAMLIQELFAEGYEFVLTRRLQSDVVEKRFSQYRQMSGGRFLVGLREVKNSERILKFRSLLKVGHDFWREGSSIHQDEPTIPAELLQRETDLLEASLSGDSLEVAHTISGYVAKKLLARFKCETCIPKMTGREDMKHLDKNQYFECLTRGGLTVPSTSLADFVSSSFALLDYADTYIQTPAVRPIAEHLLLKYSPKHVFTCENHVENGYKFAARTIVNIFYNNKQKILCNKVRKDAVKTFKRRQREKAAT